MIDVVLVDEKAKNLSTRKLCSISKSVKIKENEKLDSNLEFAKEQIEFGTWW